MLQTKKTANLNKLICFLHLVSLTDCKLFLAALSFLFQNKKQTNTKSLVHPSEDASFVFAFGKLQTQMRKLSTDLPLLTNPAVCEHC